MERKLDDLQKENVMRQARIILDDAGIDEYIYHFSGKEAMCFLAMKSFDFKFTQQQLMDRLTEWGYTTTISQLSRFKGKLIRKGLVPDVQ